MNANMNICYLEGITQCEMDKNCQKCQKEEEQWLQKCLGKQNIVDKCITILNPSNFGNNGTQLGSVTA